MFRLRALFLGGLTAGILATLGNALPAQPGDGKGGKGQFKQLQVPLLTVLLPYVGDENFQKELNLSDEQAKKLVAFRQKVWDEVYTTPRQNLNIEDQNKAIEAEFKAVLDAAHLKRASQLAARIVWSDGRFGGGFGGPGGFVSVIADIDPRTIPAFVPGQYPEIAAALKLDETLKTLAEDRPFRGGGKGKGGLVGGPFGTDTIYLTPDQTAAAKALLGDAPKTSFRGQSDTRGQFGRGGTPARLSYLLSPDVQKDLKLTGEQIKAATDLRAGFTGFARFDPAQSPAGAAKADAAQLADANAAIDKLLTADQKKRIEQIERQQVGRAAVFAEGSALGKAAGVTDDQRKAHAAAAEAHAAAVVKAVGSGDAPEKVKAAVEAAGKDRDAAVEKILTADQRAKEKEYRGEPFTGSVRGLGLGGESILVTMRRASFGRHSGELGTLSLYPGVRAELKLTEEQLQKVGEANAALNEKFPFQEVLTAVRDGEKGEKFMADRSALIEKLVTEILSKEQQARLRELMIQQAEASQTGPGGRFGGVLGTPTTPAAVPGVAEAIKLTAEQKKKLLDGTPAAEVLTDDQTAAIKKMMGTPVDATAMFARPGFPNAQPVLPRVIVLAQNPGHWDAVKVAPERVAKLAAAFNAFNLATSAGPTTPEQRTAAAEAVTKAVEAALNPDQRKRLEQIAVQTAAADSLVNALLGTPANPAEAIKTLGITDEQAKTIRAAATEFGELADLLSTAVTTTPEARKVMTDLRMTLRDRLDAKIEGTLTAGQRAKWKEMVGDPDARFTKQPLFGNRGGRGGFGGGGFGPGGP